MGLITLTVGVFQEAITEVVIVSHLRGILIDEVVAIAVVMAMVVAVIVPVVLIWI